MNLTTRGNVSARLGGVLARAGLKTPSDLRPRFDADDTERDRLSLEERRWFRGLAVYRTGKVVNEYTSFPSFRELSVGCRQ